MATHAGTGSGGSSGDSGDSEGRRQQRATVCSSEEEPSSEGGSAVLSLSSAGHGIAALGALLLAGPGGATSAANASLSASERRLLSSHGRSGGAAAATCSRMLRNRRPVWLVSMKRKLRCCFEPEASLVRSRHGRARCHPYHHGASVHYTLALRRTLDPVSLRRAAMPTLSACGVCGRRGPLQRG